MAEEKHEQPAGSQVMAAPAPDQEKYNAPQNSPGDGKKKKDIRPERIASFKDYVVRIPFADSLQCSLCL